MRATVTKDADTGGNHYPKYTTRNPIARALVSRFLSTLDSLAAEAAPSSVHDVGCGEGVLAMRIARRYPRVMASDASLSIVEKARDAAKAQGLSIDFIVESLYSLSADRHSADLVIAAEILEHLDRPELAIERLAQITKGHLLVSIPHEPLWRVLNLARLAYVAQLGNTPGHVNHWSERGLRRLLERRFEIVSLRKPLPWLMALCRPRR